MTASSRILAAMTALTVAVLFAVVPIESSRADAYLVASDPGAGAELDRAPSSITLTFNTPLLEFGASAIQVTGPGGDATTGEVNVSSSSMSIDVSAEDPGTYDVVWQTVSEDSHPISGTLSFTIMDNATSEPVPPTRTASPVPTTNQSNATVSSLQAAEGTVLIVLISAAIVALAASVIVAIRRHNRRQAASQRED